MHSQWIKDVLLLHISKESAFDVHFYIFSHQLTKYYGLADAAMAVLVGGTQQKCIEIVKLIPAFLLVLSNAACLMFLFHIGLFVVL